MGFYQGSVLGVMIVSFTGNRFLNMIEFFETNQRQVVLFC